MAKVQHNLVIHGLSGMIGKQLVVRRQKSGDYIVSAAPVHSEGRQPTPKEKEHQDAFREAIAYGKAARHKPEYAVIAEGRGLSTFNVAVADFLHPPEIRDIDLSGYDGKPGQTISITAVDDVKVATVGILITEDNGALIEKGHAVPSLDDPHRWTFTTTALSLAGAFKVIVDVADLAGQVTEETRHT